MLLPEITCNTPELRENQQFVTVYGPLCASAGCRCDLPKLANAVKAEHGFPAIAAVAAGQDVEGVPVEEAVVPPQPAAVEADPYAAAARLEALRSESGSRCQCATCKAAKQRRDYAESLSHLHSEQKCRITPGLHSFNDLPSYADTIDYGDNAFFNRNARYDVSVLILQRELSSQSHCLTNVKKLLAQP